MAYAPSTDRTLFLTASLLTIFGLLMVYSASSVMASSKHGMSVYFLLRQFAYAGAGYMIMIFLMKVDYRAWKKERVLAVLCLLTLGALTLVLFQPAVNGSHRWLRYGNIFSFQPSEIAKLAAVIFVAAYLHKRESQINRPVKGLMPCLAVVVLLAGLTAVEPDLGQALCLLIIVTIMLFVAGLRWLYAGVACLVSLPVFYFFVVRVPFRWERIKTFLDPFHDPLGSGWQVSQSLTAVGSGGTFGLGLGAGKQKLFFLPEAHSDFIFAVIGEEIGLLGTSLIALAFLVFFYRGMKVALRAPDRFGFFLGLGITVMVVTQAFINMSMVLAMLPAKGIALPFISQGGSSLLMNLMATGILLNISQYGERT